jgi:uncharacterized repeat protein (TIGR03837 family)
MQIDIYCRVIDNWGDAGVCWRLARHLVTKQQASVQLIIDEPKTLTLLGATPIPNLTITDWSCLAKPGNPTPLPDIVIAAFGCDLPTEVRARLTAPAIKTLWINLEYLSAEPWTENHHWLPSVKSDGACAMFYLPGFTEKTGGVLTEELNPLSTEELITKLGIKPRQPNERWASVFCYPNAHIEALTGLTSTWRLFVPEAVAVAITGNDHVTVQRIPQLSQLEYDTLLRACDFNFVRGEDSWISAQIAGKPFIWQPYVQTENSHQIKLLAFINLLEQTNQSFNPTWKAACLQWSGITTPPSNVPSGQKSAIASLLDSDPADWNAQCQFFSDWRANLLKNAPLCAQIVGAHQRWARIQGLAKNS